MIVRTKKEGKKKLAGKKIIFLFGPPCSGKDTQANLLAEHFNLYHFATNAVGKKYIKIFNDEETLKQNENYKKGALFDPEWILKIIKNETLLILKDSSYKGIVYDGSPRTLFEAEGLKDFLIEAGVGIENIKIIEIKLEEEELKKRIKKRLICDKDTRHTFTVSAEIFEGANCPNKDGGSLIKKDLDNLEIFKERIKEYNSRTIPALEFFKKKIGVIEVNGEQNINGVFKEILEKLETRN